MSSSYIKVAKTLFPTKRKSQSYFNQPRFNETKARSFASNTRQQAQSVLDYSLKH